MDGFYRQLLGREEDTGKRLKGWLPVACINPERKEHIVRIASTIRNNQAIGKHQITSMSELPKEKYLTGKIFTQCIGRNRFTPFLLLPVINFIMMI